MKFAEFCGSEFWDESLTWNTTNPDFTPCFQKTALVWGPCGFLWIFLPLEILFIRRSSNYTLPWTGLNVSRMLLSGLLAVLSLLDLTYWLLHYWDENIDIPYANVNSPFISAITYLLVTILIFIQRNKGRTSSGVIFLFWLLSSLAMTIIYRSHMMNALDPMKIENKVNFVLCVISYPLMIAELVLFSITDSPPATTKKKSAPQQNPCPEVKSSLLVRLIFAWFDKLAWLGFKKTLTQEDLWDLSPNNLSEYVVSRFQVGWQQAFQTYYQQKNNPEIPKKKIKPPSILAAQWKTFKWPFLLAGILRVSSDMLSFVNPLILQMLIAYVSTDEPAWRGYFYAGVLFAVSLLQSCINGQQYLIMFKLAMQIRSTVISAVYEKSLKINNAVKKTSTVGEIVNLMAVDAQRIMDVLPEFHLVWSAIIQISIAFYLLWEQLGPSALAGLGVMILIIPINGFIAGQFKGLQIGQMKCKDKRVKIMNEIFNGIKVLKLYAWEDSFSNYVSGIRNNELRVMKKGSYLIATASFFFTTTPFLITLTTFTTYVLVDEHNILDATKAFVSLSLLNIIRIPMVALPMLFMSLIQASVSFKRLNKFLISDELDMKAITHNEDEDFPIVVEEASFVWDPSDASSFSLANINLKIAENNLIAIVGSVGSGKSSLLSALLGDMEKTCGKTNIKGSIAYVAQQSWIQNATLRDNITFGKDYDKKLYKKVIEACALNPDLMILPAGDQTEIGEKGINLSGGQKQRVSLARAVYSDADIILLDDPLSAVDSHVGKHIFEQVVGSNSLLKNKTRLLVTNGVTFLPQMDSIVVMNNGKITEIGSYKELLERKGDFATFLTTYLQEHGELLSDEELTDLEIEGITKEQLIGVDSLDKERRLSVKSFTQDGISDTEQERVSSSSRLLRRYSSHASERDLVQRQISKTPSCAENDQLIQVETAESGKVKWSIYFNYIRALGWLTFSITGSCFILSHASSLGSNLWLSAWSEDPPLVNNTQDIPLRNMRLGVYAALGIGQAVMNLGGTIAMLLGAIKASRLLHFQMLTNILKCPMSFFDTTPLGRIVNRFSKDIDIVDSTIPRIVRPFLNTIFQVISTLVVISISTPIFVSIILPVGILFYIIQRFYISTSRQLKRLESITRSPIYSHFSETLSGASTIRAYGRSQNFIKHSEFRVDSNHCCYYPSVVANRWLSIRLEFLSTIIIFCAALFAVLSRDTLDAGTVGLSISYAATITQYLTMFVRLSCELESNIVAVERIQEYADAPTEAPFKIEETDPKPDWPDKGIIIFQQYSTRYRPGLDLVLKNITCHINAGEKIGIVGRTGAGKSSLTLALFRIIEPSGGTIFIDGVNTGIIGLHALRSKITIIPQDPVLFSGTLRMNLDPFSKYSDDQLWNALELSHLKEFIITLPLALEFQVAEGGENLSVGQRQLVCMARALLRKTKVLVLDEATAAIDLETDDLIQATIRKEFSDCTVLTIAHRLNTIMDSTRIIILENGEIREFDSPTTLLQNKQSTFYVMAKDAGLI